MALRSWGALVLMNIFIPATLGFAYLVHKGAGIARILFYICDSVRASLSQQVIYLHAQVTSIFW